MKRKFKMLTLLLLAIVFNASASSLYLYGTDGSKTSLEWSSLKCISLESENIVVKTSSGEPLLMPYSDLRFFSMKNYELTTNLDVQSEVKLKLFPNPVISEVTIQNSNGIENVTLLDMMGKVLSSYAVDGEQITLSLESVPTGVYLLQIESEEGSTVKPIIKK